MNKEKFTQITSNYDSHRPLLWEALEATKGLVIEMGCGYGSTPFLDEYCADEKRRFISYENNPDWYGKMKLETRDMRLIKFWDEVFLTHKDVDKDPIGVLFIDHAPGERRKIDIALHANQAKIIIAHDTEPAADHGYKMRAELKKFKYMIDYETNGAWATAVSNFIDVTQWAKNFK
jgi:hypothetical protein